MGVARAAHLPRGAKGAPKGCQEGAEWCRSSRKSEGVKGQHECRAAEEYTLLILHRNELTSFMQIRQL